MNKRAPLIGIKMKISNNKELMLKKGYNAIYSENIYQSQLNNSSSISLLFTLNCVSQSKAILRTFKNFPMIIKQVENKGKGSFTSQRYMNDSIVNLHDIVNIKIIPLTEEKAECIIFEYYDISTNDSCLNETDSQMKSKDNEKTEMDFLDNIIKYYNQEKTKDCDQTNEERDEELPAQKQNDNYQLSMPMSTMLMNKDEWVDDEAYKDDGGKEVNDKEFEEDKEVELKHKPKKGKKVIEAKYYLRKHIHTPIKNNKDIVINDIDISNSNDKLINNNCNSNSNNFNHSNTNTNCNDNNTNSNDSYLKRKTRRSRSITILKCPICLEPIDNSSYLDTCQHEFCKKCIDHWATVSSQCPCCKENFQKIIYYNPRSRNRTEKKIKKKKFKPEEEEVEQWYANCDEVCYVCKKSDNAPLLLVCDRCNFRICHTFCVGLDVIPDEDFICPECVKENQSAQTKSNRKKPYSKKTKGNKKYKQSKILDYLTTKRSVRLRNRKNKYSLRTNTKRKVIN